MRPIELGIWLALIVAGFFAGSVMFSKILARRVCHVDICAGSDDHNPGAANVFTQCGWKLGMVCLILDMLKGFLPVWAGIRLGTDTYFFTLLMVAPVLGHAIAPLNGFHGGKCIATIFGEVVALLWVTPVGLFLATLYILLSTICKINPHRRRSIVTFSLFAVISLAFELYIHQPEIALGCFLIANVAVVKHIFAPDAVPAPTDAAPDSVTEEAAANSNSCKS